jgi:hypothetical protein
VVLWSNVAVFQLEVVWHVEQFEIGKDAAAAACGGFFVCCQVVRWHPELPQSFGVVVKL